MIAYSELCFTFDNNSRGTTSLSLPAFAFAAALGDFLYRR
jgi:hypothetical protein